MKRMIVFALCLVLLLSSTACQKEKSDGDSVGESESVSAESTENTEESGAESEDEPTDKITEFLDGASAAVSERYYEIYENDSFIGQSYYKVINKEGETVFEDIVSRPLEITDDGDVIDIAISMGTGITSHRYYSLERGVMSEEYTYVIASSGESIAYLTGELRDRRVAVGNIFGGDESFFEYGMDMAAVDTPVIEGSFSAGGLSLKLVYLSGEQGGEMTEKSKTLCLGAEHYLITEKDCYVRTEPKIADSTILKGEQGYSMVLRAKTGDKVKLLSDSTYEGGAYKSEDGERNDWYRVLVNGRICYVTADSFTVGVGLCENEKLLTVFDGSGYYDKESSGYKEFSVKQGTPFYHVDLDGDGVRELIMVELSYVIVFRLEEDKVVGYKLDIHSMYDVCRDGTVAFNGIEGDVSYYGMARYSFDDGEMRMHELWKVVDSREYSSEFYVEGRSVSSEELLKYASSIECESAKSCIEGDERISDYLSCGGTHTRISKEEARAIAWDFFGLREGAVDPDNGFLFGLFVDTPKPEDRYYTADLSWFVEGSHWSRVDTVLIDSHTGETVYE